LPSSLGLQKSPWLPEVHQCVGVVTHFWVCLIKIGREVEERRMLVIKKINNGATYPHQCLLSCASGKAP